MSVAAGPQQSAAVPARGKTGAKIQRSEIHYSFYINDVTA
jgi:hypothetical protein